MSDWASGIVDVTGTKASIEAFLNRFLYDAEPSTVPGVRYFARSVLYESRDKIQEDLDTEEEVTRIVEELERQVALLRERFAGKKSFTLSVDANTPEQ